MSFTIAITGKGGVGKTTVAGLLVAGLIRRRCSPVLAVDADPNTCLDAALGVEVKETIGRVREEARQVAGKGIAAGVSKQQLMEIKVAESLIEADEFDLVAMGRPEGPGCYCYANNVLKEVIRQVADSYPFIVIDNEAGLENLSRRIVRTVDLLVIVADPSAQGLATVHRLYELAREMDVRYGRLAVVVNRLRRDQLPQSVAALRGSVGADFVLALPEDGQLAALAEKGESLMNLSSANPVADKIAELLTAVGIKAPPKKT